MKVKVRDIALKAGVSDGTVSNALNNRKGISEEKREYILKIAREMGYFKNNSSSNNNTIRLIIIYKDAHIIGDTPFFSELIRGIENECSLQGYELIIHHVNSDSLHTEITKSLKSNETKGVLLLGTEMDIDDLKLFDNVCTPLVVLDNEYDDMLYDYVAINNSDGSYAITKLLIDNGHKNIGLINSSYQINNFKKRKMGYRNALDDYNLPFRPENEILVDPSPEGSYRDTATYLKAFLNELSLDELPTAFYAVNDNIAIGAVRAFQELNIDISICGFDDLPISKLFNPPLTTVQVDKKQLGKIAVSRLINKINGDISHLKILVATKIVERDSVKKT